MVGLLKNVYRCDLSLNGFFGDIGIIRSFLQTFSSHLTWPVSENPASFPKFNLSRSRTLSQHNQTAPRKQSYFRLWNMEYSIIASLSLHHTCVIRIGVFDISLWQQWWKTSYDEIALFSKEKISDDCPSSGFLAIFKPFQVHFVPFYDPKNQFGFNYPRVRARRACALRALGLLLADGAPTVGWGKTFWRVGRVPLTKTGVTRKLKIAQ